MSKRAYKTYTKEFKLEAIRLADEADKPVTQVARELGLRVNQIYKWKEQLNMKQATEKTGVTSTYRRMMAGAGGHTSLLSSDAKDVDGYVTRKTLDGLFLMIAEEEKKIRANPLARSTDLMKKVFGAYTR